MPFFWETSAHHPAWKDYDGPVLDRQNNQKSPRTEKEEGTDILLSSSDEILCIKSAKVHWKPYDHGDNIQGGLSLSLKYIISARTSFESMKLVFWGFYRQNTSSGSAGASFSFLFVIKRESVWDFVLFSVSEKTLKGAGNESSNVNSRARASEAEHLGLFNNRSATTGPPVKEPEKKKLNYKESLFLSFKCDY